MVNKDVEKILVSEEELDKICTDIAKQIDEDYKDKHLLLVCTLKGAIMFTADLMKKISIPLEIDFMKVSSYGNGTVSSGNVNIILGLGRNDLDKTDILIVEDIVDSGRTLSCLVKYLQEKGARSVKTLTLLDKPDRREVEFTPDYVGKVIPDEFVIGYGLDYAEYYRDLPYVGIPKPEVYSK